MTLTLEKPETGARLLRFAQKRGVPLDELLEEFLDDAEEAEYTSEPDLSAIPDILMKVSPNDLRDAQEEMDSGKWVKGADLLAELRRPLAD